LCLYRIPGWPATTCSSPAWVVSLRWLPTQPNCEQGPLRRVDSERFAKIVTHRGVGVAEAIRAEIWCECRLSSPLRRKMPTPGNGRNGAQRAIGSLGCPMHHLSLAAIRRCVRQVLVVPCERPPSVSRGRRRGLSGAAQRLGARSERCQRLRGRRCHLAGVIRSVARRAFGFGTHQPRAARQTRSGVAGISIWRMP
jgi:hypothetical protein